VAVLLAGSGAVDRPVRSVPQCAGVTLSASYLASAGPEQLPAFRFTLSNHTSHEVKLAEPVPSSSHWYGRTHGRWLWRASNGAGGGLVNAGNEHGRLVVYPAKAASGLPATMVVPARQSRTWTSSQQQNEVLAYQPGCKLCSYPGEREYQVIFAYAYVRGASPGFLPCGLRSLPVPMPPKP
jgi:hypothetical protein